jgi:pimeloyl-ACP methyl ester carboxylesterase
MSAPIPAGFRDSTADVNGVTIHYVIGGTGRPLVLIHGWPQTWYSWHRIMPTLADDYTVIAVDLRGAGGSSKPPASAGYDAQTMAEDIHELMGQLGFDQISILGHDIGLLVAYAYAAAHRDAVERLVILDGLLVGIEPMTSAFQADPRSWVFGLHQTPDLPERLTAGREREYLTWFYTNIAAHENAIPAEDIDEYVRAYSQPGAMSAAFEWFRAFPANQERHRAGTEHKLHIPVLALGGEKMMGPVVVPQMQAVANDVRGGSIPDCGHWLADEAPDLLVSELRKFLS